MFLQAGNVYANNRKKMLPAVFEMIHNDVVVLVSIEQYHDIQIYLIYSVQDRLQIKSFEILNGSTSMW